MQATQNEDDQRIIAYVFVLPMRRCLDVCAQFGVENRGNKTKYRNITQFDILSAPLDAGYTLNTVIWIMIAHGAESCDFGVDEYGT